MSHWREADFPFTEAPGAGDCIAADATCSCIAPAFQRGRLDGAGVVHVEKYHRFTPAEIDTITRRYDDKSQHIGSEDWDAKGHAHYLDWYFIRMALGAHAREIVRMILRQCAAQLALGLALGLSLAVALVTLGRATLQSFLYPVERGDSFVWGSTIALLAIVTLAACLAPARRATRGESRGGPARGMSRAREP